MSVLIVSGGIGGLCLAAALTRTRYRLTCARDGKIVSEFPGECWEGIGQTFATHRAALQRVLLGAIGDVPVHMDATIASLNDRGDAVDVTLTDGASLTAALVVGADGIRSRVLGSPISIDDALEAFVGRRQPRAQWVRERTHHQTELLNAGAPHEHLARGMRETYVRLAGEI